MDIPQTILRVGATIMLFVPQVYAYYLDNFVVERVGQDLFALMGPLLLVGIICLPFFFYEIVQLWKGIRTNAFSQLQILEIMLLLFSLFGCYYPFIFVFLPRSLNVLVYVIRLRTPALVLHYALWIFRNYIIAC